VQPSSSNRENAGCASLQLPVSKNWAEHHFLVK
jgi:hypothetical protein